VTTITRLVFPDQANHHGTLFGGEALGMLASASSIAATRRARKPVVLAHSSAIDFVSPVPLGAIVETRASVTSVGRTSLAVEARLHAEDLLTGARHEASIGEFVFVAVDAAGSPTPVGAENTADDDVAEGRQTRSVELVLPGQANPSGVLFGGELMRLLDAVAFVAASRTARSSLVTARSERTDLLARVDIGNLIDLRAAVVKTGARSLTVDVEALVENALTGSRKPCTSARFVFVQPRTN
jgi:acyl-CoA hydrolase